MFHTPGPWHVSKSSGGATLIIGANGDAIAKMLGASLVDADDHLLASAPTLLVELGRLTEEVRRLLEDGPPMSWSRLEDAHAAALETIAQTQGLAHAG